MSLAFFDFDGTLTSRDTILSLGLNLAGLRPNRCQKTILMLLMFALLKSRLITNDFFKRSFCRVLLTGKSESEIATRCQQFIDQCIPPLINPSVLERLKRHVRQGDDVYLVSSNFSFMLQLLPSNWGMSGVFGTEAELEFGRFTGKLLGPVCNAQEKLRRLLERFGRDAVKEATAYGDSRGDRQLLAFVRVPRWI